MESMKCPFLELPVELRLHVYAFALLDHPTVTIGTAQLTGAPPDIIHRLHGSKRAPYPGIPEYHEPVVATGYNASLLSITDPATIPLTPLTSAPQEGFERPYTALTSLLLVNRQVHSELEAHFKLAKNKRTSLFISYPHGLHVCKTLTPHLLRQARSLHIAGQYISRTFCPARAACTGPRRGVPELDVKYNSGSPMPDFSAQLTELVTTSFGASPRFPDIRQLDLRIYYPGDDAYSTVWGDDSSPIVVALRHIFCGEVGIEVWRGRNGTGVFLNARRNADAAEKRRTVSTVWRKLEEGRRGEREVGSWVVDEAWPVWETEEGVAGARGERVVGQIT